MYLNSSALGSFIQYYLSFHIWERFCKILHMWPQVSCYFAASEQPCVNPYTFIVWWHFKEKNKRAQKDQKSFLFLSITKVFPDFKNIGKARLLHSSGKIRFFWFQILHLNAYFYVSVTEVSVLMSCSRKRKSDINWKLRT